MTWCSSAAVSVPSDSGPAAGRARSAGMVTMAYMALGIKDVLSGREPMNPFEQDHWTWDNASRLVIQAGAGPMAMIDQFANPSQALGPIPGSAWKLGSAVARRDEPGAAYRNHCWIIGAQMTVGIESSSVPQNFCRNISRLWPA